MERFQRIRSSPFVRHNAVYFFGSIAVGALNYLYYPILGRLMEPVAFGEVQTLVSLFLQFTIFLNVLSMLTVAIVANYRDTKQAERVIYELEKLAVGISLLILLASIVGGDFLREQLRFESSTPFVALALAIIVSIPLTFRSAYARGKKHFGVAALSQGVGSAAKIVLSAGFVLLGLGTVGAIGGIIGAQVAALLYAGWWAMRLGFRRPDGARYHRLPDIKSLTPELRYAGSVFLGLLSVTMLISVDIIVVKYYFDAHIAGLYAGVATVARIVFFVATPIGQVLLPSVSTKHRPKENTSLFLKSFSLTFLLCGPALILCVVFPTEVVQLLMGEKYVEYATVLPPLSIAIFLTSLTSLIMQYCLTLRRTSVALVGIMGFVATLGALLFWHGSLQAVVGSVLFGSLFTLCIIGTYVLANPKTRRPVHARATDFDRHSNLQ